MRRSSCSISALDVGLGTIGAFRDLAVPLTLVVLIRDAGRAARHLLLAGGALRRPAGQVVRGISLGEHPVDPVGPAAVMLDDLIGDLGHVSLLVVVIIAM